jgi:hypothetical protein
METVHDRRSTDLPINAIVASVVIDDPYSQIGEKIKATRSLRDDPLASLYIRSQINTAQFEAGRKFQRLVEEAQIGGIKAIDPAKESVDGGRIPEPITDQQIKACRELNRAYRELGQEGAALMHDIAGDGMSVILAAGKRHMTSKLEIKYVGRRFRECLESLAVLWNLALRP